MIPYSIVPADTGLGWRLDLVELEDDVMRFKHESEKLLLLVVEGELTLIAEDDEEILHVGEITHLEPDIEYKLIPEGEVRLLLIDFPEIHDEYIPIPEDDFFGEKIEKGGLVSYEMITGEETDGLWSATIQEIQDSPKHFHKIENEQLIVVSGLLSLEVNGKKKKLEIGDTAFVAKDSVHHLKSSGSGPVRVLCFKFPAFDPADTHCLN